MHPHPPTHKQEEMDAAHRDKEREKKRRAKQKRKEQKEKDETEAARLEAQRVAQQEAAKADAETRRLNAGQCALCGKSLAGVRALGVFDRRCCSSDCVLRLRRRLAAEAAEKRLGPKT